MKSNIILYTLTQTPVDTKAARANNTHHFLPYNLQR